VFQRRRLGAHTVTTTKTQQYQLTHQASLSNYQTKVEIHTHHPLTVLATLRTVVGLGHTLSSHWCPERECIPDYFTKIKYNSFCSWENHKFTVSQIYSNHQCNFLHIITVLQNMQELKQDFAIHRVPGALPHFFFTSTPVPSVKIIVRITQLTVRDLVGTNSAKTAR